MHEPVLHESMDVSRHVSEETFPQCPITPHFRSKFRHS